MPETVVVTGAAGYIGSHLSQRLESEGVDNLVLIDDFSRGKQEYLDFLEVKTPCMRGDLKDYSVAKDAIKNADTVWHIAARIGGVQYLHGTPLAEYHGLEENLVIDRNVFRACVENNVKKIIYTSSVSVFPTKPQFKKNCIFKEEDIEPLDPEGGYGWAKLIGEKQLEMMSKAGIRTGVARIFKSYGNCDDFSDVSGQVVCMLCRKAVNYPNEDFIVWGDGTQTRCLLYIDDCIDALMKIEEYTTDESLTVNLGSDVPIPIKTLAEKIVKISEKDIPITYDTSKPVGPLSRAPNISKIKKILNWKPTTTLDEGLIPTYEWVEEALLGKKQVIRK